MIPITTRSAARRAPEHRRIVGRASAWLIALALAAMGAAAAPAGPPDGRPTAPGGQPRWLPDADGRDLVLIHGLGASSAIWQDVTPYLGGSFRLAFYELHGHGRTRPLPAPSITAEVAALGAWLDEQGLARPHLIGHGLGGMIALQFALENPQRVRSLAVIDAGPRQLLDEEQKRSIARALLEDYDRYVASRFVAISRQEEVNERAVDMALRTDSASLASLLLSSFEWDVTDLLPGQSVPLLVIGSEAFLPARGTERQHLDAYGYGDARLLSFKRIDGVGHYLMLENPTRLAANILVWLRGQDD